MICKYCGFDIKDWEQTCQCCGRPASDSVIKENKPNFSPSNNQSFNQAPPQIPPKAPAFNTQPTYDKKDHSQLIIILSAIIIILIIASAAVFLCLNLSSYDNDTGSSVSQQKDDESKDNDIVIEDDKDNKENSKKEEKLEKVNLNDGDYKDCVRKLSFSESAVVNLYTKNKLYADDSNYDELKKQLAFSRAIKYGQYEEGFYDYRENNSSSNYGFAYCLKKDHLKTSAKDIFGDNSQYKDGKFRYRQTKGLAKFNGYDDNNDEIVYYNDGTYKLATIEGGGGDMPCILQSTDWVEKGDKTLKIYVRRAFADTKYNENTGDFDYTICRSYKNGEFNGRGDTLSSKLIYDEFSDNKCFYDFATNPSSKVKNVMCDMDLYCYTFKKSSDGKFYLYSFEEV